MKVKKIMQADVVTSTADAPVAAAAKVMWENDCGFVPVLEEGALVGVVTDRDVCMAALMTGLPLGLIRVREVMTTEIHTCDQDDELTAAHSAMREQQIRRMPVVNADDELVGVLSLNDLTNEAYSGRSKAATKRQRDAGRTLAAVCEHHEIEVAAEDDEPEEEE